MITRSEQQLLVLNALPYALLAIDHSAKIVFINSKTRALFELSSEELVGLEYSLFLQRFEPGLQQSDQKRYVFYHDHAYLLEHFQIEGNVYHLGIREIVVLSEQAQEIRRAINLVAYISHEYRAPIAVIRGFSDLLLRTTSLTDDQRELVEAIRLRALLTHELTNQVSLYARILNNSLSCEPENVALVPILQSVMQIATQRHASKRVTTHFHYEHENEKGVVYADEGHVLTILQQVVDNAFRYNQEDGRITIHMQDDGDQVTVTISDTGKGISEEDQRLLFQVFSRFSHEQTEFPPGAGFGLFIARELITRNRGTIAFQSIIGQGTTFRLTFPKRID
jgi:signal transduction histidine kinase